MSSDSRRIVFVCHTAAGESLRSARAISKLDGVILLGISQDQTAGSDAFGGMMAVPDVHDSRQLIEAARTLSRKHGSLNKIVTAQETLLLPVAETNEALGLPGMSVETVRRTLDKSQLKSTLKHAGIKTPRDRLVESAEDAWHFANEVGFPIIIKPLGGSGALTTFKLRNEQQLAQLMELVQPSATRPLIAEAYVLGVELCVDTITIANEPQFYSICEYNPPIMHALEDPARQWQCVMPRLITDHYQRFVNEGLAAVRALAVGNAMTHMEGFINRGGPAGFIDATLRPAGARIGPMLGFACDIDPYRVWARVAVDGAFDGPWERKYVVGTIFLRSMGSGFVEHVEGVDTVNEKLSDLLVEAHWPKIGVRKSLTYTGDGFITIRHPDTGVIRNALELIERTVHITYSGPEGESPVGSVEALWSQRLQNYMALNKPAWEATL